MGSMCFVPGNMPPLVSDATSAFGLKTAKHRDSRRLERQNVSEKLVGSALTTVDYGLPLRTRLFSGSSCRMALRRRTGDASTFYISGAWAWWGGRSGRLPSCQSTTAIDNPVELPRGSDPADRTIHPAKMQLRAVPIIDSNASPLSTSASA